MGVGVYVLSIGNYDTTKGTYTLDFYLILRRDAAAAPSDFSPLKFEFMNGRATSSPTPIFDQLTNGTREVWDPVQAALHSEPQFQDFPYDKQSLEILVEDTANPVGSLVYEPLTDVTALDDGAKVPGWRTDAWNLTIVEKEYKFGERYSRVRYEIIVYREGLSSTLKTLLPPSPSASSRRSASSCIPRRRSTASRWGRAC